MISVLVADDQPLVRAGVAMLLSAPDDIVVAGEAADGREALELARATRPDVVVMDVRMPGVDGIEATRMLVDDVAAESPDHLLKVLMLTTFDDDETVYGALKAGASGFLLKQAAPQDLIAAVRAVAGGGSWLDQSVTATVLRALSQAPGDRPATGLVTRLTPREREVLVEMAAGHDNRTISSRLFLSEATVKTHVSRILLKTGSRDRTQAVVLAYQSGLATIGRRSS